MKIHVEGTLQEVNSALSKLKGVDGISVSVLQDVHAPETKTVKVVRLQKPAKKRVMSQAAREKIAAAQRLRWSKEKKSA